MNYLVEKADFLKKLNFDDKGLVVAIAQQKDSSKVLMQAFMNQRAIEKTIETGFATYYSRSRKKLWKKGETSGNLQKVAEIYIDCDGDSILLIVDQVGSACHTGELSCFFCKLK